MLYNTIYFNIIVDRFLVFHLFFETIKALISSRFIERYKHYGMNKILFCIFLKMSLEIRHSRNVAVGTSHKKIKQIFFLFKYSNNKQTIYQNRGVFIK